jgi:hypothetical protein
MTKKVGIKEEVITPIKLGRPFTYDETLHPGNLIALMTEGALDCEIYAQWNISKMSFYRWLNEHEELKEAHEIGLSKCEAWWTKRMRERFEAGDDKGFKYCIAIMNNKFGWEKGSKSDGNTTNININNMNVLENKSRDSLLEYISAKLLLHKDVLPPLPIIDIPPEDLDNESK